MIKHCKTFSSGTTASWGGKYSSSTDNTIIIADKKFEYTTINTQTFIPTTSISYHFNSTNGTITNTAKPNLRRFWLFNNGSLSRTAEYDPLLLQILL